MKNLPIQLENNEPVISTLDIAEGLKQDHRSVFRLVAKYKKELEEIRFFAILNRKIKSKKEARGRKTSYCFLNEEQSIFLVTLMRNSPKVVIFKKRLSQDFIKMRRKLLVINAMQTDPERLVRREAGKVTRRVETDAIKEFVEYCYSQGSTNAKWYYKGLTEMANDQLFLTEYKFKNLRDILNTNQLSTIETADEVITRAIKEGMGQGLHYKEIYKLAKKRVETLAAIRGKTFIPAIQQIEYESRA